MKIVFDHDVFSLQQFGGISRYICELGKNLATENSKNVSVVAPLYVNHYLRQVPKSLKVLGFPVRQIRRTGRIIRTINWAMAWPIIRYLKPDIVHETYYSAKRIAPKNAQVVLTVHDMIHEHFSDQFSKKFSIFDSTMKVKATAVARADHIICISKQTRQDLIELLGVNPAKVTVVYHGFSLTSESVLLQKVHKPKRPFLLYVGVRDGYKNFIGLLQAFGASTILKSDFDLICFGGGAFSNQEVNLFHKLGVSSSIVHQVSGDDAALASHYKTASAFIYPSLYEGFGIPPLEAMSFNCPVVCSNVSSIPEVVGNAGLMFDPSDIESIRLTIEKVIGDRTLQESLIARGQERLKIFSWEQCAKETLAVYHKVLV